MPRFVVAATLALLMAGGAAWAQRGEERGAGQGGPAGARGMGQGGAQFGPGGRAGAEARGRVGGEAQFGRGQDMGRGPQDGRGFIGGQQRGQFEGFRGRADQGQTRDFAPQRGFQDGRRDFQPRRGLDDRGRDFTRRDITPRDFTRRDVTPRDDLRRTDRLQRDFRDRFTPDRERDFRTERDRFVDRDRDLRERDPRQRDFRDRDARDFRDRIRDRDFRDREDITRDFRDRDFRDRIRDRDRDFRDRDDVARDFRDRFRDRDFRDREDVDRDRIRDRMDRERDRVRDTVRRDDERVRDERDWTGRWRDRDRERVVERFHHRWRDRDRFPFVAGWWVGFHQPWGFWAHYGPVHRNPWFWWTPVRAPRLAGWIVYDWPTHYYWDYGPGEYIFYRDGAIYVNNRWYQPAPVYYERTVRLIEEAPIPDEEQAAQLEWQPLGVFAVLMEGRPEADVVVQLAITQEGVIGGTAFDQQYEEAYAIEGAVEEDTQRVVWAFTDVEDRRVVTETSLFNLTQPQATGLVAYAPDDMRVVELVRIEPPEDAEMADLGRERR